MAKAYMQNHHKVLEAQYEAMRQLCDGTTKNTFKLFCHILVCSLLKMSNEEDDDWTPVSCYLIAKRARGASWRELKERGLIENTGYRHGKGENKCREFKVTESVLEVFLDLGNIDIYETALKVNLFDGKPTKTIVKNVLKDSTDHPEPPLIRAAMQVFAENKCLYEAAPIKQHLAQLREEVNQKRIEAKLGNYSNESLSALDLATRRYLNDDSCFKSILDQDPKNISEGFYEFTPAYRAISTGRIHFIRGGLQSCSREMKKAAYSCIPNVQNYDLSASQVNVAIQLFEDAGISTEWLTTYRDTPNYKDVYAARAGISIDCWKICILALLMGARLPKTVKNANARDAEVLKQLSIEAQGDSSKVLELLNKFTNLVEPLIVQTNDWHNWLLNTYIPQKSYQGGRERKHYITNVAQKRLCVEDLPTAPSELWLKKARVSAFLLQGLEATFIHHLTLLGTKYGYKPLANEHDGLVVLGLIPSEAVDEAATLSGLRYAKLGTKAFG